MNALTNVKNIKKLSEEELKGRNRTSWHEQYRSSAWVFIGGLPFDLTEGDIICVFSQYGELVNINLVRDKETGKSKGFCFICYEDQRSTDLAVDNLNGIKILGRTIRVDHVANYKPPKNNKDEEMKIIPKVHKATLRKTKFNVEDDFSKTKVFQDYHELNRSNKNRKKKSGGRVTTENESKSKIKNRNFESLNLESSSSSLPSSSSSSSSSASISSSLSSSSSSLSSSSSSSSSSSEEKEKKEVAEKIKNTKNVKDQSQKKNRTIEDLKREARLIQAELKRRQQTEEPQKTSFLEFREKHHSRKRSRSGNNEREKRREDLKIRQEKIKPFERKYACKKIKKKNRSNATSRTRRRSRTPERHRHL